jgi:hypothetical protein
MSSLMTKKRSNLVIAVLTLLLVIVSCIDIFQRGQSISEVTNYRTITHTLTQINLVTTTILAVDTATIVSGLYSQEIANSFKDHLQSLESLNVSEVMREYQKNSTFFWDGNGGNRLGGIYSGEDNISQLMSGFFGYALSISIENKSYSETQNYQNTKANVNATLFLVDENQKSVYSINATIEASISYSFTGSEWLIGNETWLFLNSTYY